jgi:phospholipase/carboxylesterase
MQARCGRYRAVVIQQAPCPPQQLFLLAHGWGSNADDLVPLGERIASAFPNSTVVSLEAPAAAGNPGGFQWFSLGGIDAANRPGRVAEVLPAFLGEVRAWQHESGATPAITALVGFSQGAEIALEASLSREMPAARVAAIAGRFAALPDAVAESTTIHLVHGKEDSVVPYGHTIAAAHRLLELGRDVTADIVPFIGHEVHEELVKLLLLRLRTHVPRRLWQEAMRDVPAPGSDAKN